MSDQPVSPARTADAAPSTAWHTEVLRWCGSNPAATGLILLIGATLAFFFGYLKLFSGGGISALSWALSAWTPETNYEHAKLIPFIAIFLVWHARDKLRAATVSSSRWGLVWMAVGALLFLIAARTLQPRIALAALPVILWGAVLYVCGAQIGRILLFPIGVLLFMVPLNPVEQATFRLQFLVTGAVQFLSNLIGINVTADGTTLQAADNSFGFQIIGGCSGIKSIMAMTMVAAIYVYLTQDKLWKKLLIFGAAGLFAVIGNIGRVFTIIIVARFINPEFAGGQMHDYSGFIFFPFAIAAMLGFSKLVNLKVPEGPEGPEGPRKPVREVTTYDY